jgi:hypothetical protein
MRPRRFEIVAFLHNIADFFLLTEFAPQNWTIHPHLRLPSPSRHIYNSLTIAGAFRRLPAFDRPRQYPIKVDGTFA